jgi:hypothetical protein
MFQQEVHVIYWMLTPELYILSMRYVIIAVWRCLAVAGQIEKKIEWCRSRGKERVKRKQICCKTCVTYKTANNTKGLSR